MSEEGISKSVKSAIEEYQCPGCVCGSDTECYTKGDNLECGSHVAGTTIYPAPGRIFLGMPIGFCRTGNIDGFNICIFESLADGWGFDKFNVPAWKHLDAHKNTLVRGISPRVNRPFIHIYLCDCVDSIDCIEITEIDINEMD